MLQKDNSFIQLVPNVETTEFILVWMPIFWFKVWHLMMVKRQNTILPVLILTHEPVIVFFFPVQLRRGSDTEALVRTLCPARVNPPQLACYY